MYAVQVWTGRRWTTWHVWEYGVHAANQAWCLELDGHTARVMPLAEVIADRVDEFADLYIDYGGE